YWFVYTPRFFGGAISGSLIALFVLYELDHSGLTRRLQKIF
ncbi:hydroxyethylthiazole permease, partial [Lacticaseibacillus rhamnosus]